MKLPFPVPAPPSGCETASTIVSLSRAFKPRVPSPRPVDAVTVHVVPEPLTLVIAASDTEPPDTIAKSDASTPVTASLKVMVQETEDPVAGSAEARLTDTITGGALSIKYDWPAVYADAPMELAAASLIVEDATRSSRTDPLPLPVLTITVRVAPLPV